MERLHETDRALARRNAFAVEYLPLGREMLDLAATISGNPNLSYSFHGNPNVAPELEVDVVGLDGRNIAKLDLRPLDSVWSVKMKIKDKTGLFPHQFKMVWGDKILDVDKHLYAYDIPARGAIFTIYRTRLDP